MIYTDALTCEEIPNDPRVLIELKAGNDIHHVHIDTLCKMYKETGTLENPFTKSCLPYDLDLRIRTYIETEKRIFCFTYDNINYRIYIDSMDKIGFAIINVLSKLKNHEMFATCRVKLNDSCYYDKLSEEVNILQGNLVNVTLEENSPLNREERNNFLSYIKKYHPSFEVLIDLLQDEQEEEESERDSIFNEIADIFRTVLSEHIVNPIFLFHAEVSNGDINRVLHFLERVRFIDEDNLTTTLTIISTKYEDNEQKQAIMLKIFETQRLPTEYAMIDKKHWKSLLSITCDNNISEEYLIYVTESIFHYMTKEDEKELVEILPHVKMDSIKILISSQIE